MSDLEYLRDALKCQRDRAWMDERSSIEILSDAINLAIEEKKIDAVKKENEFLACPGDPEGITSAYESAYGHKAVCNNCGFTRSKHTKDGVEIGGEA